MNEKPKKVAFIPCGDAMEKMCDGICEDDFENVFGHGEADKDDRCLVSGGNVDDQIPEE